MGDFRFWATENGSFSFKGKSKKKRSIFDDLGNRLTGDKVKRLEERFKF